MPKGNAKESKSLGKNQKKEVINIIKGQMKEIVEYKTFRTSTASTSFEAGVPIIDCITEVPQGTLDSDRVGDTITLKRCRIRLLVRMPLLSSAADQPPYSLARVMVVQYKDADMTPALSALLANSSANSGGGPGTYSARNIDYLNNYNILYDRTVTLEVGVTNASNYAPTGKTCHFMNIDVPMKYAKKKIQFQAASTNHTNGLWIFVTSDNDLGVVSPVCYYGSEVQYTDQ